MLGDLREGLGHRYRIGGQIIQGGMGTIFLAEDLVNRQRRAIKVLSPWLANQITRERFLREIRYIAQLTFEHIVPILESGEANGLLYYVMPLLEGESLRQHLDRKGRLPLEDALAIVRDVANALSWAHVHGIVHRDVKPENIFLTGGRAVVMDFGVAVALSVSMDERLTRPGEVLGTPLYMSPEQAMGRRRLDHRTDVYALGCVLYEMLTNSPPFRPSNPNAVIVRRFDQPPPRARDARPDTPERIDRALARALAWLPADRFETVAKFAAACDATNAAGTPRPAS